MCTWIDESYGTNGYKIWMYLLSWIGLLYILNFLFGDAFRMLFIEGKHSFPVGIYFSLVIVYCILFGGGWLFLLQCKKIAQEITSDGATYSVQLFMWGKLQFSIHQIKNIEVYNPQGIKRYATPFGINRKNFKINLTDGSFFYVSGLMTNVDTLIEELR